MASPHLLYRRSRHGPRLVQLPMQGTVTHLSAGLPPSLLSNLAQEPTRNYRDAARTWPIPDQSLLTVDH